MLGIAYRLVRVVHDRLVLCDDIIGRRRKLLCLFDGRSRVVDGILGLPYHVDLVVEDAVGQLSGLALLEHPQLVEFRVGGHASVGMNEQTYREDLQIALGGVEGSLFVGELLLALRDHAHGVGRFGLRIAQSQLRETQIVAGGEDTEVRHENPHVRRRVERRRWRRRLVGCGLGRLGRARRGITRGGVRGRGDRLLRMAGRRRDEARHQQEDEKQRPTSPRRAPVHEGEGHSERDGTGEIGSSSHRPTAGRAQAIPGKARLVTVLQDGSNVAA